MNPVSRARGRVARVTAAPHDPPLPRHFHRIEARAGVVYCLSPLAPAELIPAGGLPREAILGVTDRDVGDWAWGLRPNQLFMDLLTRLLTEHAELEPTLTQAALALRVGVLELWDGRVGFSQRGEEDLLGCFQVREGRLMPRSFNPNRSYTLVTERGAMRLPARLQAALLAELRSLRVLWPGPSTTL